MPCRKPLLALIVTVVALLLTAHSAPADDVDFERDVAPLLVKRCLECHSESEASGQLILTTQQHLLKGGESGAAIVPGSIEDSFLLDRVRDGEMPPEREGKSQQLAESEIRILETWIAQGANWPANRTLDLYEATSDVRGGRDWWSLQPIHRPTVPAVDDANHEIINPIDAFVLARLQAAGLTWAPHADKRTLIRRLYFDLLGLPPSAAEIDNFVNDASPDAYEALVDRLLASPHFGERYARHWLDLVRYAETSGYERDQEKPGAWKYRDWVVQSINDDKPYDRFVIEQLAGDELDDRSEQTVIATGFLRLGTWNDEPNDPEEYKYDRLEDLVHATSTAFLGLTIKCARCHDHKFDPIPQVDYYRVGAAFWPGPIEARGRELLGGPSADELGFDVLGWTDIRREPPPLFLLRKGDPRHPQKPIDPGFPSLVPVLDQSKPDAPADANTTQRRRQLAEWIVHPDNPLTPRVYVNRLWMHHFGQALVRTPNNFGFKGDLPTHPQLLDWLADELIRSGWRSKPLHKLMVMSRTYRQSSVHPDQDRAAAVDVGNHLWWHAERRRLDAESLRDAMLSASGQLDRRLGGPSFKPDINPEALEGLSRKSAAWNASPAEEQLRRSLYIYSQRSLLPPLMTTFDFCDTTEPCGQRDVSIVAPQALALLNNQFVHQQSDSMAQRILAEVGSNEQQQIRLAWRMTLTRDPTEREMEIAARHLETQTQQFQKHAQQSASEPQHTDYALPPLGDKLRLHLIADQGISTDEDNRVMQWLDQSPAAHHAEQNDAAARPLLIQNAFANRPALRFDGSGNFFQLDGQVIKSPQFTIAAVVTDRGSGGAREIISNWNGAAGNSTRSVFLGTTGAASVRFSDDFANQGPITANMQQPFLIVATCDLYNATLEINGERLAAKGSALHDRRLDTAYVVGTQGNHGQEFWHGDIAEILVVDRALGFEEQQQLWHYAQRRYGIAGQPVRTRSPAELSLASLCHVLLNTNEFIYVD